MAFKSGWTTGTRMVVALSETLQINSDRKEIDARTREYSATVVYTLASQG
jgi:hypothetical protein